MPDPAWTAHSRLAGSHRSAVQRALSCTSGRRPPSARNAAPLDLLRASSYDAGDSSMNLALFDFDGTITFGDTFTPFVRSAVSRTRLAAGSLLLGPLVAGYRLGLVPATRLRSAMIYVGFRGRRALDVTALGERYAQKLNLVLRPEALARIDWHRSNGDRIVIVSASLDVYLKPWCAALGVELISSELESSAGVLTGSYAGSDCTGAEKARRVRERCDVAEYTRVYAYGDTREDRELLALASHPYFRWRELREPL